MSNRIRILPYKQGSRSAKALAEALGGKVLKLSGSIFKPSQDDLIINWGSSTVPDHLCAVGCLNGQGTTIASNKLLFMELMKEENADVIPQFWTSKDDIPSNAYPVVCRTILSGHSGAGIVIAGTPEELVEASLYVKYEKKKDEYRVHVGNSGGLVSVISLQKKGRRTGFENPNYQVRNHANGFVYMRQNISPPPCVVDLAGKALCASGLDFGAIDVIYNEQKNRAWVLEINTAPGLEGQTVQDYADFFKKVLDKPS